jgi:hypothetical protein
MWLLSGHVRRQWNSPFDSRLIVHQQWQKNKQIAMDETMYSSSGPPYAVIQVSMMTMRSRLSPGQRTSTGGRFQMHSDFVAALKSLHLGQYLPGRAVLIVVLNV